MEQESHHDANNPPVTEPLVQAGLSLLNESNRALWMEIAAVIAVGIVPFLLSAVLRSRTATPQSYWNDTLHLTANSICIIYVVLYLIHRSGEPFAGFGIDKPRLSDFPLGVLLFAVMRVLWICQCRMIILESGHVSEFFPLPVSGVDYAMMIVKYTTSAYMEELVTRGYLITRFERLFRSHAKAVLFAAFLFASYHAYQGMAGILYTFMLGLVFGFCFLLLRRVWPLAIGHMFWNCLSEIASASP